MSLPFPPLVSYRWPMTLFNFDYIFWRLFCPTTFSFEPCWTLISPPCSTVALTPFSSREDTVRVCVCVCAPIILPPLFTLTPASGECEWLERVLFFTCASAHIHVCVCLSDSNPSQVVRADVAFAAGTQIKYSAFLLSRCVYQFYFTKRTRWDLDKTI